MSTKSAVTSRAAQIAARSVEVQYKEVKTPDHAEDFTTAFKDATGPKTGIANQFFINVLPSFVSILLFVIYHAQYDIKNMEPRDHAKVSTPTYVAYCMTLIYAYFLISDAYVRPQASVHAEALENDTAYRKYIEFLLTCPVPIWLEPVLKYFTVSASPRRPNVWFTPTAAGFNHFMHFGRFFPINLFTSMHDIAATSNSRSNPEDVLRELHLTEIFTMTNYSAANVSRTVLFHEFFASLISVVTGSVPNPDTQYHHLANKVNQIIRSLFNPILLRSMQQKQAFTTIDITPPTFTNANYNPYVCMLSATKGNLPELRTLFSSISSVMNGTVKCNSDLAGQFKNPSGVSILVHGYSRFATPTWQTELIPDSGTVTRKSKPMDDVTFANLLRFKSNYPDLTDLNATRHDAITATLAPPTVDPANQVVTINMPTTYTVQRSNTAGPINAAALTPSPTELSRYDSEQDLYPQVKILNPFEEDSVSAWITTLCGMIIETEELAGSAVPAPHPDSRVEEDNAIFATSAIPFSLVYKATSFKINCTKENACFVSQVAPPSYVNPSAMSMIRSLTRINFPHFTTTTYSTSATVHMSPGIFSGTTTSIPQMVQTFLGFTLRNKSTTRYDANKHQPVSTPLHRMLVFSPYTFINASYDPNWDHTSHEEAMRNVSFLTNMRTIFGTDPTLIEVNHPLYAMPIA